MQAAPGSPIAGNARRAPRVDRFDLFLAILTLAVIGISALVVVEPGLSFVVLNARLDLVIEVVASLVAVGVAGLAWISFRERHETAAIFLASAFVVLAVSSALVAGVVVARLEAVFGSDPAAPGQAPLYGLLMSRLLAGILLLFSVVAALRGWTRIRRPGLILLLAALATLMLWGAFIAAAPSLPPLLGPEGLQQLKTDPLVPGVLPGRTPALVGSQIGIAALFGLTALLYRALYRRTRRPAAALFAVGLLVAAFSNVNYALYPAGYTGLTTSGDWLRLGFYVLLLFVVASEASADLSALQHANIELERLRDAEVARAALEERALLAREVHDGLAQDLWFAKLKHGRLLARRLEGESRVLAEEVAGAIEAALAEARQAVWASRVDPTQSDSFPDVVARFVEDFADRYGLRAQSALEEPFPILPARTQAELLRIVQEALNNVRKHADATVVRVRMSVEGDELRVAVEDNGRGFDPASIEGGGVGLQIMGERATAIGASYEVGSEPGSGTTVRLRVPLAQ